MRILVTGGSGFIGRHVVDECIRTGHRVLIVDRNPPKRVQGLWRYTHADVREPATLSDAFGSFMPEAVIHLAAQSSIQASWDDPVTDMKVNAVGTANVLRTAQEWNCRRLVFASTSAVYEPKLDNIYTVESRTGPIVPYGVSKLAAEGLIRCDHSLQTAMILRLGNVYGPGQKPLGESIVIARALDHLFKGTPFLVNGDGEQTRDWVYVEDVARAFLMAAAHPTGKATLNIGSGVDHSVNRVLRLLAGYAAKDIEWDHGPAKEGELRHVTLRSGYTQEFLGWESQVLLTAGLKRTVEAYRLANREPA